MATIEPEKSEKKGAPEQEGLAVSFETVGIVLNAEANVAEVEAKQVEAQQGLGVDILEAQIDSLKANADLAAATIALYKAFRPD